MHRTYIYLPLRFCSSQFAGLAFLIIHTCISPSHWFLQLLKIKYSIHLLLKLQNLKHVMPCLELPRWLTGLGRVGHDLETEQQQKWPCGKESLRQFRRHRYNPWVGKIPWRRKWPPTPVLLPGKSHGQRNLTGYSPWGCKEMSTT